MIMGKFFRTSNNSVETEQGLFASLERSRTIESDRAPVTHQRYIVVEGVWGRRV
jgi:hypothetical protein